MRSRFTPLLLSLLALLVCQMSQAAAPKFNDGQPRPVTRSFLLKELLEHDYADELVSYPITFAAGECRKDSLRLVDGTSAKEIPFQLENVKTYSKDGSLQSATVWFWVDTLPAMGRHAYTLYGSASAKCKAAKFPASPVKWTPLDLKTVEVSNGIFSLRLAGTATFPEPKNAAEVGGPLRGFKGADGVWRGAGELQVESPVTGHTIRVTEHGPLWTVVAARMTFVSPPGTGGAAVGPYYEMRFKLFPGRDFCRVTEKSDFPLRLQPMRRDVTTISEDPKVTDNWRVVPCPADNFILNCDKDWQADRLYTHVVFSKFFANYPLLSDEYRCHTAIRSALPYMNGGWFATYATKGNDLLGIVGIDASHWQYPDNSAHFTAGTPGRDTDIMFINEPGKGAYFRLPLARMERHWLLVVTTKGKVVKDPDWVAAQKKKSHFSFFADRIPPETCYLWQLRYQYGDLPLNKVKNWILDYDEPQADHPNLFPEVKDREAVLKNIEDFPGLKKHFDRMYNSSEYLQYLKTGTYKYKGEFDPFSGISCVRENLDQGYNAYIYVLSTGQYVPGMMKFCDIVAPAMTPEDWKRMCRYTLAGTYILADDDYWQYAYVRGETTYLPNFNTCRWSGIGLAGLFFKNHPESKKWINFARYYLEKEFDYHISEDGVGAENVGNYYPFAWRMISELIRVMSDRGIADYRSHPKYLAGTRFWLDVITPPDVRFNPPQRMVPPIGNHPYSAPRFGMYEWNANLQQQVNPELAAWSHWAWRQTGEQPDYHHLIPFNMFLANKDFPEKVPPLQSKPLKDFGYIFRNHFPSDKETYMSFKAGNFFYHHDGDEGSFHMYAKGVPLAADGLELIGYTKANVHNMVEIPEGETTSWTSPRGGELIEHLESPEVDWAAGFFAKENTRKSEFIVQKLHTTDWRRDIVLIKAKNPEDAEYFAVYDNLSGPDKSIWNLDVHSEEPTIEEATATTPATVRYPGIRKPQFNLGLDVIFVTPANPAITMEKGTINKAQLPAFPIIEHWFIRSPRAPKEDTFTILFPRRPDQPAAKVTPLLDGKACIVEHQNGRDIIFASPVPVSYKGNDVEFTGRYAVIRDRAGDKSLTLLEGTTLSFGGKTLTERGSVKL
ncbi:MAG: hypothetical protein ACYC7E_04075 [Armatimonadota bacterium]